MSRTRNHGHARRGPRSALIIVAAIAGFAVAAASSTAGGKSFTLKVTKRVHVDNTVLAAQGIPVAGKVNKHESVVVGPSGYAVYTFEGETTHHLICKKTSSMTTNCWGFWPPVTVNSAKASVLSPASPASSARSAITASCS